jgi:hypothetical protein
MHGAGIVEVPLRFTAGSDVVCGGRAANGDLPKLLV